ncbi:MAG: outer membrane beta-barrel protein [Vicinamibacterales bacterium]
MNRTLRTLIATVAVVATSAVLAPSASAQMQWTDKGFANVSFGVQAPSQDLVTNTTFEIYGENASQVAAQQVGGGAFFDISGGYKVWKNLAAGVGLTFVGSSADLVVDAQIPDPDFFDRPRPVSTTLTDAKHRQTAINLTGTWMMPVTDKVDVGFQFGPTIFLVSQDVPGTMQVAEPGPTITSAQLTNDDHTSFGIHFGVDATYLITPKIGAGVLVRYTYGSVDIVGADDNLTLGGFQIGFGGRYRF